MPIRYSSNSRGHKNAFFFRLHDKWNTFILIISLFNDWLLKCQGWVNILWYNILTSPDPLSKSQKGRHYLKIHFSGLHDTFALFT